MEIRKVTIQDVERNEHKIVDLFDQMMKVNFPSHLCENQEFQQYNHHKPDEMRQYIKDGSAIIFGSFENEELTGFIWGYKKNHFGELRVHIAYSVVDEAWRDTMAHVALTRSLFAEAKKIGAAATEGIVTNDNERLVEYYQRIGYQIERLNIVKYL